MNWKRTITWILLGILCAAWISWVVYAFQDPVPGLLDDGVCMATARSFEEQGFFHKIYERIVAIFQGDRFYEIHFLFLALCWFLFHQDLFWWYMGNLLLNVVCGACVYAFVIQATKNRIAGAFAAALVITSSPVAETIRGGFGKAEAIMGMFFAAGICAWYVLGIKRKSTVGFLLAGLLIICSCVAKESGNLLALSLIIPSFILCLFQGIYFSRFHSLGVIGVLGFVSNYLVFLPSKSKAYISKYFAMDFSINKIKWAMQCYFQEIPDVILLLSCLSLAYGIIFLCFYRRIPNRKKEEYLESDHALAAMGISFCAFAGAYLAALLGFRFHLVYYTYIPLILLALAFGIGYGFVEKLYPKIAVALATIFFITRIYSIGFLFLISGAQRLLDDVNFQAFTKSSELGVNRLFSLDLPEESQFIQEWNFLRRVLNAQKTPPLYGSFPRFQKLGQQECIRFPDSQMAPNSREDFSPEAGDIIAYRYGSLQIGNHTLRTGMPLDRPADLDVFRAAMLQASEPSVVACVERTMNLFNPNILHTVQATYGWKFLRLNKAGISYSIIGKYPDNWMKPDAAIKIINPEICPEIRLSISVPEWLSKYPVNVSAIFNEKTIATLSFEGPGTKILHIPVKEKGEIQLQSDVWTINPRLSGTRKLSYHISQVK